MISLRIFRGALSSTRVNLYKLFTRHYVWNVLLFRTSRWKPARADITIAPKLDLSGNVRCITCGVSITAYGIRAVIKANIRLSLY